MRGSAGNIHRNWDHIHRKVELERSALKTWVSIVSVNPWKKSKTDFGDRFLSGSSAPAGNENNVNSTDAIQVHYGNACILVQSLNYTTFYANGAPRKLTESM